MNVLLGVITKSLSDLEKGPSRYLEHDASDRGPHCRSHNFRVARPEILTAVRLGEVLLAVQEELVAPIRRHDQKPRPTCKLDGNARRRPSRVWLSGLFNPMAYLTSILQVTARATGSALDAMTQETHMTVYKDAGAIPPDSAFSGKWCLYSWAIY